MGYAKNRKPTLLPLKQDTAIELKSFFRSKMAKTKAFGGTYKQLTRQTSNMIKADLADADIDYVDESGLYADFHSLRHTTGSLLAASGVHPKVAQSIMRHSDINLTMSRYTHTLRGQEARAIETLPDLSKPSSREQQKATGTDGSAYKPAYKKLAKQPYFDNNGLASNVTAGEVGHTKSNHPDISDEPLSNKQLGNDCHPLTSKKPERAGFEPAVRIVSVRRFSKPLPSATRSPLQVFY